MSGRVGAAVYGVAALGLEKAVALGVLLYLPRHLDLADYGRFAFITAYLGFFQVLPDASLEAVVVTELAGSEARTLPRAGEAALVRLAISLLGAALGLAALWLVTDDPRLVAAGAILAVGPATIAGSPYRPLLRAELRMREYVAMPAAQAAVALGLLAWVVHAGGGIGLVATAVGLGPLGALVAGRLLVGPGARLGVAPGLARTLVRGAWPLAGVGLALNAAQQVVQLLLIRVHGAAQFALLGGAQKVVEAIGLLPQALMISALPMLARAAARPEGGAEGARELGRVLVLVIAPLVAVLALWPERVLTMLLGPALVPGGVVLRALALATLLGATGAVLTNLLLVTNRQRVLFGVTAAAAAVMVVLGGVLVPRYAAVGAAGALVGSMVSGQGLLLLLPATRADTGMVLGGALRPLVVATAAAVVVSRTGAAPGAASAGLVAVYAVALVVTRTVTRADVVRWWA